MSARSAQRKLTRRRRWRMGRDIAGEREMRRTHGRRVSGLEALVVEGKAATPSGIYASPDREGFSQGPL